MVQGGPARATRSAKKAEAEKETKETSSSSAKPSACELQAALLHVNQMLALLDAPLAQGRSSRQPVSMHDGLVYSLTDLLIPLNSLMRIPGSTAQNLAAAIGAQNGTNNAPGHDLGTYVSNISNIANVLEQLNSLLNEPMPGSMDGRTALQILEQQLALEPLSQADERDVLLRMRQKRRRLLGPSTKHTGKGKSVDRVKESDVLSPLYPMPNALQFSGLTPWLDECMRLYNEKPIGDALSGLVNIFNEMMLEQGRAEAEALSSQNRDVGQHIPAHRVRARLAAWQNDSGEIQIEIRNIAIATISLQVVADEARIARVTMCAPHEFQAGKRRGVSGAVMPSRFASYNEISDHLLISALERQRENNYIRAVGHTLEHVAALRTLFDPLPIPESHVPTFPTRICIGTLPPEKTIDNTKCLVWKWCRALIPNASAPQGEWCAYSPQLL